MTSTGVSLMMNIAKHLTIAIVCCACLAFSVADAGEEMSREPGPGEIIAPTKTGDEKTTQLLVGTWMHEEKIGDDYEVKQTYTFEKDGSYQMSSVKHIRKEKSESKVKGQWTVRDGILTLTPTDPKGEEGSLYGRFTAYTILKINDTTIEWQVNWQRSDASPAVKRTLTITTHKRVK
jgi:Lipocalin-like domain